MPPKTTTRPNDLGKKTRLDADPLAMVSIHGMDASMTQRFGSASAAGRRVHIVTYGCQMNVYDSRRIVQILGTMGFTETFDEALADLILVNTCSVREGPERKVLGTLNRLRPLKEVRPDLRLGVCGCVGQQHGKALLDLVPFLDLVFGPDNLCDLPDLISALDRGERVSRTTRMSRRDYRFVPLDPASEPGPTAFLTLMKGCDKVCSFCIVPHVRGREVSKPAEAVESEVAALVARGVREVTLLGQNVNSYGKDRPGDPDFVSLLERLDAVPGLRRLRFVTSHPADADRRMMSLFGRLRSVCEYLHLPVQAGSDRILKAMRRGYTAAEYLEKLAWARDTCPDIALSTDVIVGFPGETAADFDSTLRLVETARFDTMFSFKYSPRPHTTASRLADDVPDAEKSARLHALQELQDEIGAERSARFLGRRERILIEGLSRAATERGRVAEWTGRTRTNRVVNFDASSVTRPLVPGEEIDVVISAVLPHSLHGTVVAAPASGDPSRQGDA